MNKKRDVEVLEQRAQEMLPFTCKKSRHMASLAISRGRYVWELAPGRRCSRVCLVARDLVFEAVRPGREGRGPQRLVHASRHNIIRTNRGAPGSPRMKMVSPTTDPAVPPWQSAGAVLFSFVPPVVDTGTPPVFGERRRAATSCPSTAGSCSTGRQ